jgi:hypothetical protein
MSDEIKKNDPTPEQLLMNCLEDCGRYERIIVVVETSEGFEFWSNGLGTVERKGLLEVALLRENKRIFEMESH